MKFEKAKIFSPITITLESKEEVSALNRLASTYYVQEKIKGLDLDINGTRVARFILDGLHPYICETT